MFINVRHKSSNELDFSQQHQIFKEVPRLLCKISPKIKNLIIPKNIILIERALFCTAIEKNPTSIEVFQCKNLSYHHHSSH